MVGIQVDNQEVEVLEEVGPSSVADRLPESVSPRH